MPAIPVVIKEQVIVKEKRTRNKGQGAAANKDKSPPPREKPKVPDVPTKCPMCGKTYPMQRTYFPQVGSSTYAGNYSYTAVCMDCIEKFFNDHMEMYSGDMQKAVRRTCEWIDAYYDPKIMDRILPEKQGMEEYLHRIRMSVSSINKSFDDTLQDEGDRVYSGGGNVVTLADAGLSTDDLSRAVNIFGEGFEEKAYGYMYRIYRGYIDPLGDTATAGQLKSARFLAALEYRCMEAIKNDKPNASALSSAPSVPLRTASRSSSISSPSINPRLA